MSIILGFNEGHDGSVCVVKNGKVLAAVSTERVTRVKKQKGWTSETIDYVLDAAGINIDDVDHWVMADTEQEIYGNNTKTTEDGTVLIPHHLAHAASVYYTSPFDKSWVFTLDSSWGRHWANSSICFGEGNKLVWKRVPLGEIPGSIFTKKEEYIGCMYSATTEKLGLGNAIFKAGTTMGLACYGQNPPENFDFWNFEQWEIGTPGIETWTDDFQEKADIALACQLEFERQALGVIDSLDLEQSKNLCLSGGSFLNCTLNGKVVKQSGFEDFHIYPACGDDGLAVGAALYYAHTILDEPRQQHSWAEQCYTGKDYPLEQEPDYEQIAQLIADGNIVGWFHGKSEFGPRALGNRSILADPRTYHTREKINHYVKNREWFRPFAPVVLEEATEDWFDWQIPSPFMLYTAQVKRPNEIQAVTHVDNSARLQTINKETNEPYYNLVKAFGELTGVPVLLNTSLNDNGQPIVETPEQALEFLHNGNLNYMVINGIIHKA